MSACWPRTSEGSIAFGANPRRNRRQSTGGFARGLPLKYRKSSSRQGHFGRGFARFLAIACGSTAELRTQLCIAGRIGIIEDDAMRELW
ncbi:MAG: four helix bundle protein [Planctomycetota bacterium]